MSEVDATGMLNCIPECAVGVYNTLRTLLWERATYWRGQTLHSFTNKVFSGPQKRTSGCGSPRFYYVIKIFLIQKRLIGFLKAQSLFYEKICFNAHVFFHDGMLCQCPN